ncbi:MAG: hypothetical protein NC115_12965, partial [Bacteroidales bacterium]|nr:hypothetical protein [Bacteroides sp.]MCM1503553.1 hypothetical protein [Bacteroidales bacterium]
PSPQKTAEKLASNAVVELAKGSDYKSVSFTEIQPVMSIIEDNEKYFQHKADSISLESAAYRMKLYENYNDYTFIRDEQKKLYEIAKTKHDSLLQVFNSHRPMIDSLRANFTPEVKAYTIEHTCKILNAFGTYTQSTFVVELDKDLTTAKVKDQKNLSFTEK